MIDWDDFPIRTPQQRLEEGKRVLGVNSMEEFQQEAVKLNQRLEYLFQKYIVSRRSID